MRDVQNFNWTRFLTCATIADVLCGTPCPFLSILKLIRNGLWTGRQGQYRHYTFRDQNCDAKFSKFIIKIKLQFKVKRPIADDGG